MQFVGIKPSANSPSVKSCGFWPTNQLLMLTISLFTQHQFLSNIPAPVVMIVMTSFSKQNVKMGHNFLHIGLWAYFLTGGQCQSVVSLPHHMTWYWSFPLVCNGSTLLKFTVEIFDVMNTVNYTEWCV